MYSKTFLSQRQTNQTIGTCVCAVICSFCQLALNRSWCLCIGYKRIVCLTRHSYGQYVQLRGPYGAPQCTHLWGRGTLYGFQFHEGCPVVQGAAHGPEEGSVRLVPAAQDLLCTDAKAEVHGTVQRRARGLQGGNEAP